MSKKLYYSSLSPYARTVRVILFELDIDYESDRLDKMRPIESISLINPNLSIPVLQDDELTLFDSGVISEYLFDTYGQGYQGAHVDTPLFIGMYRSDNKWNDLKVGATIETLTESLISIFLYQNSINAAGADPNDIQYLHRQKTRVNTILEWLNGHPVEHGFYPGYFTVLDLRLISALGMCDAAELFDWSNFSELKKLVVNFKDRESLLVTAP